VSSWRRPDRGQRRHREQDRHLLAGPGRRPRRHPLVVVAPESTVDPDLPDGTGIHIEERHTEEVTTFAGHPTAPAGTQAFNPAFDVTPADLITAVVTEERTLLDPDRHSPAR